MVYDYFADYAKKAAHLGIECTFPRSPSIAIISGGIGWYAYQCGMTYGQKFLCERINDRLGYALGTASAPFIVPWLCPYLSTGISLGASLTSSFTLNMVAHLFFGVKAKKDGPHPLPQVLKEIGIDIPSIQREQPKENEPLPPSLITLEKQSPSMLVSAETQKLTTRVHAPKPIEVEREVAKAEKIEKKILPKTIEGKVKSGDKDKKPATSKTDYQDLFGDDALNTGWCCFCC